MNTGWQVWLYVAAVLIPLFAFAVQVLFIQVLRRLNAYIATGAILSAFVLSAIGFVSYFAASGGMHPPEHVLPEDSDLHVQAREGSPVHLVRQTIQPGDLLESLDPEDQLDLSADPPPPDGREEADHEHEDAPVVWYKSWTWVALGAGLGGESEPLTVPIEIYIDNLAVIMFVMVTLIASLIHLYSMGYMRDDPRYPRFFAYLSLFCFSMLGLVASGNVFMIFIFWELVGVCSYFLIGHWYEEKKNADAANKAFITNRVGDVGMLIGLGLLWTQLGTFSIAEINQAMAGTEIRQLDEMGRVTAHHAGDALVLNVAGQDRTIAYGILVLAGLGIFAGCVGKSAQFPLHVWLPDAMAGPTPVSALIHAATMVAAGVYLVGRFFPLFTAEVLLVIAYTGGITLLIAATIALVQTDYKKVLAYSTVSQLGFMMLALGVGGWAAGLFHLLTHACFKALLFLGAGSVFHAVHTYEMPYLGGLRKKMPITAWTMLLATAAISGVPLLSGFYSKDAIFAASIFFVRREPAHFLLLVLPSIGAALTALYMFRMWFLIFTGTPRPVPEGHEDEHHRAQHGHPVDHAHESEPLMAWTLIALAIPTVAVGWPLFIIPFTGHPILEDWLAYGSPLVAQPLGDELLLALGASLIVAGIGIGLACLAYWPVEKFRRINPQRMVERFGGIYIFLVHKWYFDELYDALLVKPTLRLTRLVSRLDNLFIDGLVNGSAAVTVALSKLNGIFDLRTIDGLVNGVARVFYVLGDWSRAIQTGRLRGYLMFLSVGVVVMAIGLFLWIRG